VSEVWNTLGHRVHKETNWVGEMRWKVYIERPYYNNSTKIFLLSSGVDGCDYYTVVNGFLTRNSYPEGTVPETPLLELGEHGQDILEAFVKGLAGAGIVHHADNAERIVSQALVKEKDKELEYYKDLNKTLITSLVKNA